MYGIYYYLNRLPMSSGLLSEFSAGRKIESDANLSREELKLDFPTRPHHEKISARGAEER